MDANQDKSGGQGIDQIRERVLDRLIRVRARHTTFRVVRGLATILSASILFTVGLITVESAAYLSPLAKTVILAASCLVLAASLGWWIIRPLLRPPELQDIVHDIESSQGGLHQHLTNILQLWDLRDRPGNSRDLIDAAVRQAADKTSEIDFTRIIDTAPAVRSLRRLGLSLLMGLLMVWLLPGGSIAFNRLSNPTTHYARPQETRLLVAPGDTVLVVGDSLALHTEIDGVVPLSAVLLTQEEGHEVWSSADIPIRDHRGTHRIANVRKSFVYQWRVHDAESELYQVLVKPRPVVLSTTALYRYPTYTGLADRVDTEGGDIVALEGTGVTLRIRSSRALRSARLSFDNEITLPADVSRDSAEASFVVDQPIRFTIGLVDSAGISNANPVSYRVLPLKDEPPAIILLRPGRDSELGEQMQVALMLEATDDFGISRAEIAYRVNRDGEPGVISVSLADAGQRDITQLFNWDLSDADLLPGDQVVYRLLAYDSNKGVGETREFVIRFPSLTEIHEAALRAQEEAVEQLEDISDQNRRVQEKMKDVAREILKHDEATWENRAEIREAIKQCESLSEKIDQNLSALEQTRERLEQSGLLTPETLEKLQQIQSLMESLKSPDLQRISQELRDATDDADPEMIRETLERMAAEQESFQQNLDRTIALLERVRNQQMLDALTSRLQNLARDQEKIHQETTGEDNPLEELSDRQSAIEREAENLEETLEEAASTIETPQDRLSDLSDAFEKEQVPDRAAQSKRDLQANQRERSQEGTRQLSEDLSRLADEMQAIREDYRQQQKDELIEQLTGIFNDLLNVSRSQEQVAGRAKQGNRAPQEDLAKHQTRDLNATARIAERMADASKKTFLIPPEAGPGLQNAMNQMQKSVGDLQRGLGSRASTDAREAMAGLNTAAMAAWEAISAVKGAGSATGLDEMLQQLADTSDRQGDLNAETEGMMGQPGPGGKPQDGLGSLSAEQQAIQQMLDELRQKFGQQEGDALGDLGKISEDMEDVAQRLSRDQLDNRTVDQQRGILSRMLDAQRSLRQRGFSNDREARTGSSFAYRGPRSLPTDLGESDNPLRSRLREALGQGFRQEDQALIRKYFDRLMDDAASGKATP
jgi:hypothetical protein